MKLSMAAVKMESSVYASRGRNRPRMAYFMTKKKKKMMMMMMMMMMVVMKLFVRCCYGYQINKHEVDGACIIHGRDEYYI
jgi:recombinational DNA repair protein RecR